MNEPKNEQTILEEALDLPPEERAAYLADVTQGNPELRAEVESLLKSYGAGEFLEHAAVSEVPATARTVSIPLTERPGDTIGRYKLLQQIGEGGCGVVYMAEQSEPVRRRVALKIIKLGMDTRSVIARFEAERQALALMDHPNIAKVFDAGATETGRPYFVMELVRGMKITDYCDERKLTTRARLDLFIQVCQAIQHAHQKGIIHRDIKPSNILVTVNDGVAVPKVIDFGVAKATSGQQLTDKTLFTAFEQFIGTPAYMSPEQAVLTSVDIDTRSDIYALGVLLYELLTGRTPLDTKELLTIGLDEMRRTIREKEPERPSMCVRTLPDQALSTTAQRRGLEAPKLISELRGDLDWIVMKCLEKDRARRYDTANGLTLDIQRHLNCEPVVACPPSKLYEFQKTVRRHKVGFVATAAVIVSLACGLVVAGWMLTRERAAVREQERLRRRADEQAAMAQAVNDFLKRDLLVQASGTFQFEAGHKPDPDLTVREALYRAAERIGDRFIDQPAQEAAVRHTIGVALSALGDAERAIPQLDRALTLARNSETFGPDHYNTLIAMGALGSAYDDAGKPDQAVPLLESAFELMKTNLGSNHWETVNLMNTLAAAYEKAGKFDLAVQLYEALISLAQANPELDQRPALVGMSNLGGLYAVNGRLDDAQSLLEDTLDRMRTTLQEDDPYITFAKHNLALVYANTGKLELAQPLLQEALAARKATLGPGHPETQNTMQFLANVLARQGQWKGAADCFEGLIQGDPTNHWNYYVQAPLLVASEDVDAYRDLCEAIVARFQDTSDPMIAERMAKDCLILPDSGVGLDAVAHLADTAAATTSDENVPWAQLVNGLADYRQGHFASAVEWLNQSLTKTGVSHERDVQAYIVLAMAHQRLNEPEEARTAFARGAAIEQAHLPSRESGYQGGLWFDVIIARTLMDEATTLIESTPSTE